MQPYGVSFTPTNQALQEQDQMQGQFGAPGAPRGQEAIRVLQLRLPRVVGGGGIAPAPLLGAPGGMGAPGPGAFSFAPQGMPQQGPQIQGAQNPMMQAILQLAQMSPMGGAPRVTPGVTPNEPGPNANQFPNAPAPGGPPQGPRTPPMPDDIARPSPNPGGSLFGQPRPQDFPLPYGGFGQVPPGFGNRY